MAIVIRYFSTAAAGTGDGSTWANRAALFSAGVWSDNLINFSFTGSDSLEARIGPGTYTCSQLLQASSFYAGVPSASNSFLMHGCDSSGNRLSPPNPNWTSAQPAWDDSALPVIATTTNIATLNLNWSEVRLIKFTATARTSGAVSSTANGKEILDWVVVESSSNGSSSIGVSWPYVRNSVIKMTGAAFDAAATVGSLHNCRLVGVTGTSGNRRGFDPGAGAGSYGSTITGFGGSAVHSASGSALAFVTLDRCTLVANGGNGVLTGTSSSQNTYHQLNGCFVTGNSLYGVNAQSLAKVKVKNSRFRNNTSGDFNGFLNHPTDMDNVTSAGTDADEFVDTASGDYRVKYGSAYWGKAMGAGDGPATITG